MYKRVRVRVFLLSMITTGTVYQTHLLVIIIEFVEVEKVVCHRVYDKTSPR